MEIHLIQSLLHVLHFLRCLTKQILSMSRQSPQGTNLLSRTKGGPQQSHRMEILEPLAITNIGLSTRHIFDVSCIDQTNAYARCFQTLKDRNPINSGRLYSDGGDAAFL